MIESEFPSELGTLFRNLENKGNPWGQNNSARMDWAKDLDFEVPVYDGELARRRRVPVLDRLRRLVRRQRQEDRAGHRGAAAHRGRQVRGARQRGVLHRRPGAPLGQRVPVPDDGPADRGDAEHRVRGPRAGQAQDHHDLPALHEHARPRVPAAGGHDPQLRGHQRALGGHAPHAGAEPAGARGQADPGEAGRRRRARSPTTTRATWAGTTRSTSRRASWSAPRARTLTEMPRHADRSLCCGAGGARMWMEENIGKRINLERVDEALDTNAKEVVTGCPFCRVMITDGLVQRQSEDKGTDVQVRDVSQMLLESVKRGRASAAPASTRPPHGPGCSHWPGDHRPAPRNLAGPARPRRDPVRRRLRRRHAADRGPVHLRGGGVRQRPRYAAQLPGRDPRARGHAARGVVASSCTSPTTTSCTPGDRPDVLVAMNPAALKANIGDLPVGRHGHREHRRVHQAQPHEGRLRGQPARGRLAGQLPGATRSRWPR